MHNADESDATLRSSEYGAGLGFCYEIDRELFIDNSVSHGPMLIAVDSNFVLDLQEYGSRLIDGDPIDGCNYLDELHATLEILELWFLRDIRFLVMPGVHGDHRGTISDVRATGKARTIQAVEDALTFQLGDWGAEGTRFTPNLSSVSIEEELALGRLTGDLDRELVRQATGCRVDVFLTRDGEVLRKGRKFPLGMPNIWKPTDLAKRIDSWDGEVTAGTLQHANCPLDWDIPFPDMGKIGRLLESLD